MREGKKDGRDGIKKRTQISHVAARGLYASADNMRHFFLSLLQVMYFVNRP